ncbi:MAG: protein-L-isoaspartate O-methyltransferase [Candidatus Omnitrophota bacterium]|nr:MAG: protein-L-isoaspartate O-methyltransferase [Candidatus Omnitrophota bacterium]
MAYKRWVKYRRKLISCIGILSWILTLGNKVGALDYDYLRERMVKEQIIARGIKDERVIKAMLKVERHKFVPEGLRWLAYQDRPLPIGYGQTISQPYIVALMTELLGVKGDEKVLEIGTGSGYQAAILAEIVKEVYTIEILEPLAKEAEAKLKNLGYENIKVKCGDGFLGWPEYAPFDCIIVTCAPEEIPHPLIEQLKEGGRMVVPVGKLWQELKLILKEDGKIKVIDIVPVRFVPMLRGEKND